MFGFDALAAHACCETAFDRVRKGEVPATAELVLRFSRAHMRALVETMSRGRTIEAGGTARALRAAIEKAGGGAPGRLCRRGA